MIPALCAIVAFHQNSIALPKVTSEVQISDAAAFDADAKKKLDELAATYQQVALSGYPTIIHSLQLETMPVVPNVRIIVTDRYNGVAATSGSGFGGRATGPVIRVSAKYALAHPADLGMIVHEMVHVVQSYPKYDPVWLTEGIADWVRWFMWEKVERRPKPNPAKAHARDSYQTTGSFLYYATVHYNLNLVPKLNMALKENRYNEGMFKELTGRTFDQLETEWLASLGKSAR